LFELILEGLSDLRKIFSEGKRLFPARLVRMNFHLFLKFDPFATVSQAFIICLWGD